MSQPKWRTIFNTDYSRLQEDTTGQYAEELEIAQEIDDSAEDEDDNKFELYRFPVDQLKLVPDDEEAGKYYLVSLGYDKSWPHAISRYEDWFVKGLSNVARSCGMKLEEIVQDLCSKDPKRRASAYECIGSYHGYENLDGDPITLTQKELNKHWN